MSNLMNLLERFVVAFEKYADAQTGVANALGGTGTGRTNWETKDATAPATSGDDGQESDEAPQPKKRGRKAKSAVATDDAGDDSEEETQQTAPAAPAKALPTKQDVLLAMKNYAAHNGAEGTAMASALIKKYDGALRISELDPKHYQTVIDEINTELAFDA